MAAGSEAASDLSCSQTDARCGPGQCTRLASKVARQAWDCTVRTSNRRAHQATVVDERLCMMSVTIKAAHSPQCSTLPIIAAERYSMWRLVC